MRISRRILFRGAVTLTLAACVFFALSLSSARTVLQTARSTQEFGVTFSPNLVRYNGNDPQKAFAAVIDDLGIRKIRIPVYWDDVESTPGVYNFSDVDWYMDAAREHGAMVTLAIGVKVPRWPECHEPSWVTDERKHDALLRYLDIVVARYKDHSALLRWQVENEPFFPFGDCPAPDVALLNEEIARVRADDPYTPIQLTVSGEQEPWAASADSADVLGVSMYRFSWSSLFGLVTFPHPPEFYALQAASVANDVDRVVISELQAEPWFSDGVVPVDVAERYAGFTVERLHEHIAFARRTGLPEIYLWGVEWWYDLAQEGETRLWDGVREEVKKMRNE